MKKLKKNMKKEKKHTEKSSKEKVVYSQDLDEIFESNNVIFKNFHRFKRLELMDKLKENKNTLVFDYLTEAERVFKICYEKSEDKNDDIAISFLEVSKEIQKFKKENLGKDIFEIKSIIENSINDYSLKAYCYNMVILLDVLLSLIDIKIGVFVDDEIDKMISTMYALLKISYKDVIASTNILKLFFVFLLPLSNLVDLFGYYIMNNEDVNEYDFEIMEFVLKDKFYLYE